MSRLIDADALKKVLENSFEQFGDTYSSDMLDMFGLFNHLIDNTPTVEQPTGEWINIETSVNGHDGQAECNLCGCIVHNNFTKAVNLCPKCGAKMKGGEGNVW